MELPTDENPVSVVEGDCLDVLRSLPDGCVDAVITDPPYSQRTHSGHDASARGARGQGFDGSARAELGYGYLTPEQAREYTAEMCRVCSGWVVVMTDHVLMPHIYAAMEGTGRYVFAPLPWYAPGSRVRLSGDGPSSWTDWIVVSRTAAQHRWGTLPGGYSPDGSPGWRDKQHMGGKPTRLMRHLVRDYSREGQLILDPFAGSGTTGIAAALEGRRCILIEKEPAYARICRERVAKVLDRGLFADV